jgi:hypothetical protein
VVDLVNPAGTLTAANFLFQIGNDNSPAGWAAAPAPASVVNRPGAGTNGSTRVEITWLDGQIENTWLRVTVKGGAGQASGLAADDVFYFGNQSGESGNSAANAQVNALDEILARYNAADLSGLSDADAMLNVFDFNRDRQVNALDEAIAGSHYTYVLNQLNLITVPTVIPNALTPLGAEMSLFSGDLVVGLIDEVLPLFDEALLGLVPLRDVELAPSAIIERDAAIIAVARPAAVAPVKDTSRKHAEISRTRTLAIKTTVKQLRLGKGGFLIGLGNRE